MKSETDAGTKLRSRTGATDEGDPLSINRAPDKRIRPWVSRSMVAYAYPNGTETLQGVLCNDAPYLRSAVGVDWTVDTKDGELSIRDETFLCGQHSQVMPLRYSGGIKVAGLMLRPGALRTLFGLKDSAMLDRIVSIERGGVDDDDVTSLFDESLSPTAWLLRIENWLAEFVQRTGAKHPSPIAQALELQAFTDPNGSLNEFADRQGVSQRTVERTAKRDFGLQPSQIMRRARILDLAARLCGVADEEEEEIMLRFFDQAHQIREFQVFFGMTPMEFQRNRSALLTLSLEIRQARRLELLDRLEPGAVRPWMRKPFLTQRA
ncbi:helix-turn-helix domain-containing protein [Erythrobacter sp. F6033]|uniref:helix-turn-helix domain-containing protein n=1 Tax=Erythrobacter sp. F6033 TaxID=2926401 RepID=UPI001FF61DF3|nr:helix-turn-helix domain-containing protein [Erythrobacter sp. F6033]MCK0127047.1 helix-turn-helix domain-containing protein [Erythrobacter sp. F6033]